MMDFRGQMNPRVALIQALIARKRAGEFGGAELESQLGSLNQGMARPTQLPVQAPGIPGPQLMPSRSWNQPSGLQNNPGLSPDRFSMLMNLLSRRGQ